MYIIQVNGRFYYGENEKNKSQYGYYINKSEVFNSLDDAENKGKKLKDNNKSALVTVEMVSMQTIAVIR